VIAHEAEHIGAPGMPLGFVAADPVWQLGPVVISAGTRPLVRPPLGALVVAPGSRIQPCAQLPAAQRELQSIDHRAAPPAGVEAQSTPAVARRFPADLASDARRYADSTICDAPEGRGFCDATRGEQRGCAGLFADGADHAARIAGGEHVFG
jgi:hypothetical protein